MNSNKEKIWVCHIVLYGSRRVSSIFQPTSLNLKKKKKKSSFGAEFILKFLFPINRVSFGICFGHENHAEEFPEFPWHVAAK